MSCLTFSERLGPYIYPTCKRQKASYGCPPLSRSQGVHPKTFRPCTEGSNLALRTETRTRYGPASLFHPPLAAVVLPQHGSSLESARVKKPRSCRWPIGYQPLFSTNQSLLLFRQCLSLVTNPCNTNQPQAAKSGPTRRYYGETQYPIVFMQV